MDVKSVFRSFVLMWIALAVDFILFYIIAYSTYIVNDPIQKYLCFMGVQLCSVFCHAIKSPTASSKYKLKYMHCNLWRWYPLTYKTGLALFFFSVAFIGKYDGLKDWHLFSFIDQLYIYPNSTIYTNSIENIREKRRRGNIIFMYNINNKLADNRFALEKFHYLCRLLAYILLMSPNPILLECRHI